MTEKEKMLAGQIYDASDPALTMDRKRAKELCARINRSIPPKRTHLLQKLFQTKKHCHIEPVFFCDYGYNIILGDNFYANHNCVILDVNLVTIGNNVKFGPYVQVYTATHPLDYRQRDRSEEMGYPIIIGHSTWIGGGAIICPGVTIGDHSVIGAGSVVVSDIPPDVVAAGNPCKIIRKLQ